MKAVRAILAAGIVLLAFLAGCHGPEVGKRRTYLFFYPDGTSYVIRVKVEGMWRTPVLDRQTPAAGETDDGPDVSR